jgi:hypothetical protein
LNSPIPDQTSLDEALLDEFHYINQDYLLMRSEMAVLKTEKLEETNYSFVITAGTEGRYQTYLVSWAETPVGVEILNIAEARPTLSPVISPKVYEVSGITVLFSLLQNHHWDGEERYHVQCGSLEVKLESGSLKTYDVSDDACAMILSQEKVLGWRLFGADGKLITEGLVS